MSVAVVGHVEWVEFVRVDHVPAPGEIVHSLETWEEAAGGGAVTVKMRGDFEVISIAISPDLVKDGDVEMLQDLTVAALNEARRKFEESLQGKLVGMLPPGMM